MQRLSVHQSQVYLGLEEQAVELGNRITKGQRICYIESGYTYDEIVSEFDGEVDEIFFKHGETNDATDLSIYNFSVFNYDARISRESCSFCGCQAESCKLSAVSCKLNTRIGR